MMSRPGGSRDPKYGRFDGVGRKRLRLREERQLRGPNSPAAAKSYRHLCVALTPSAIVGVAMQTVQRCVERITRLYEQGADEIRIGDYVRRWWTWVRSGLGRVDIDDGGF